MNKALLIYAAFVIQVDFLGGLLGLNTGIMLLYLLLLALACLHISIRPTLLLRLTDTQPKILIWSIFFFCIYASLTLLWTRALSYGTSKILISVIKLLPFLLLSPIITKNINSFFRYYIIVSLFLIIAVFISHGTPLSLITGAEKFDRLGDEDNSNPIIIGRYFGMSAVVYLFFLARSSNIPTKFFLFLLLIICLSYSFLSGSKGPLLSLIAVLFFLLVNNIRKASSILIYLGIVPVLLYLFVPQIQYVLSALFESDFVLYRYLDNTESYDSRGAIIYEAFSNGYKYSTANLIAGFGSGDYGFYLIGNDEAGYPHNFLAEIVYEYGLVGMLLLLPSFFIIIKLMTKNNKVDDLYTLFVALTIYFMANSMVSGDISNNIYIYSFAMLSCMKKSIQEI